MNGLHVHIMDLVDRDVHQKGLNDDPSESVEFSLPALDLMIKIVGRSGVFTCDTSEIRDKSIKGSNASCS